MRSGRIDVGRRTTISRVPTIVYANASAKYARLSSPPRDRLSAAATETAAPRRNNPPESSAIERHQACGGPLMRGMGR
jgi:hypothetical protein